MQKERKEIATVYTTQFPASSFFSVLPLFRHQQIQTKRKETQMRLDCEKTN